MLVNFSHVTLASKGKNELLRHYCRDRRKLCSWCRPDATQFSIYHAQHPLTHLMPARVVVTLMPTVTIACSSTRNVAWHPTLSFHASRILVVWMTTSYGLLSLIRSIFLRVSPSWNPNCSLCSYSLPILAAMLLSCLSVGIFSWN